MKVRPLMAAIAFAPLLAACAGAPSRGEAEAAFIQQQSAAARAARERGDLARALALWRSVAPLQTGDTAATQAIRTLQEDIARESEAARRQAQAAYARGDRLRGDARMRRVLLLRPGDPAALAALRDSFTARADTEQAAKSEQYYAALVEQAQKNAPPPREPALSPTADTAAAESLAAADRARAAGEAELELDYLLAAMELRVDDSGELLARITQVRRDISQRWYREGTALLQGDLPAAIEALEKSLAYDPDNRAARLKLRQARTLLDNLRRIEGGG